MKNKVDVNKGISKAEGGVLSKLWRTIVKDKQLIGALDLMVDRYVAKTNKTTVSAVKRLTKSSLTKNITANEMTWRVFLSLIFDFLGARRVDIIVKIHMPNGEVTPHVTSFKNPAALHGRDREEISEDDKDEKQQT